MLAPVAGLQAVAMDKEEWPTWKAVMVSQQAHREQLPTEVSKDNNGVLRYADGAAWIPATDERVQLRLLIVAHCSAAGLVGSVRSVRSCRVKRVKIMMPCHFLNATVLRQRELYTTKVHVQCSGCTIIVP
jgi:hypothetical protein